MRMAWFAAPMTTCWKKSQKLGWALLTGVGAVVALLAAVQADLSSAIVPCWPCAQSGVGVVAAAALRNGRRQAVRVLRGAHGPAGAPAALAHVCGQRRTGVGVARVCVGVRRPRRVRILAGRLPRLRHERRLTVAPGHARQQYGRGRRAGSSPGFDARRAGPAVCAGHHRSQFGRGDGRVVLISPFTSLCDMARHLLGRIPLLPYLLRHRFDNRHEVAQFIRRHSFDGAPTRSGRSNAHRPWPWRTATRRWPLCTATTTN